MKKQVKKSFYPFEKKQGGNLTKSKKEKDIRKNNNKNGHYKT